MHAEKYPFRVEWECEGKTGTEGTYATKAQAEEAIKLASEFAPNAWFRIINTQPQDWFTIFRNAA